MGIYARFLSRAALRQILTRGADSKDGGGLERAESDRCAIVLVTAGALTVETSTSGPGAVNGQWHTWERRRRLPGRIVVFHDAVRLKCFPERQRFRGKRPGCVHVHEPDDYDCHADPRRVGAGRGIPDGQGVAGIGGRRAAGVHTLPHRKPGARPLLFIVRQITYLSAVRGPQSAPTMAAMFPGKEGTYG